MPSPRTSLPVHRLPSCPQQRKSDRWPAKGV